MGLLEFARSRRGGELIGTIVLSAGLSLALALLSYHPNDSSAFFTSTSSTIQNWIGYYGATIAWLFVGFFGFASFLFPAALLIIGWNRFLSREMEFVQTKLKAPISIETLLVPSSELVTLISGHNRSRVRSRALTLIDLSSAGNL